MYYRCRLRYARSCNPAKLPTRGTLSGMQVHGNEQSYQPEERSLVCKFTETSKVTNQRNALWYASSRKRAKLPTRGTLSGVQVHGNEQSYQPEERSLVCKFTETSKVTNQRNALWYASSRKRAKLPTRGTLSGMQVHGNEQSYQPEERSLVCKLSETSKITNQRNALCYFRSMHRPNLQS